MKTRLTLPALVIGLSASATCALAGPKYDNGSGGQMWWYGQIDPSILSANDGQDTITEFVDNNSSNTRAGIWIVQPYDNGMEFSFNFETALGFAESSGLNQLNAGTRDVWDWDQRDIRKADLRLKTAFGTFWAGQGSMASDGAGQVDLSGTTLVNYVSIADVAGGILLRRGNGTLSGITIGSAFASFDGGRFGRVRYQTPEFAGFSVSAAWGQDILNKDSDAEIWDAALRYGNSFGDVTVSAAMGYQSLMRPGSPDRNDTFFSASALHASGVNVTFATGERNTAGSYWYLKAGYRADWLAVGETALAVDYYSGDGMALTGPATSSSSDVWGVGVVQGFDDLNLETYLGYRLYSFDDNSGASYQDASTILLGARWKF